MSVIKCLLCSCFFIINYNLIVWGKSSESSRIFVLQKGILRTIFKMRTRDYCSNTFVKNNILTFYGIFIYKCVTFVKWYNLFPKNYMIHNHFTRQTSEIHLDKFKLSSYKKSLTYLCRVFFSKLSAELKHLNNYNTFKIKLKHIFVIFVFILLSSFLTCKIKIISYYFYLWLHDYNHICFNMFVYFFLRFILVLCR